MSLLTVITGKLGRRKLGWRPRRERDFRDKHYQPGNRTGVQLKAAGPEQIVTVKPYMVEMYDQGGTGSCVWQAVSGATACVENVQGLKHEPISRRQGYHLARRKDGLHNEDAGCYLDTSFDVGNKYGCASEAVFPWSELRINQPPPVHAILAGDSRRGLQYEYLRGTPVERRMLVGSALAEGLPVIATSLVGYEFQRAGGGVFDVVETRPLGGHAYLLVSQLRDGQSYLHEVWNSWGRGWADDGCLLVGPRFFMNIIDLAVIHGWKRSARAREQLIQGDRP